MTVQRDISIAIVDDEDESRRHTAELLAQCATARDCRAQLFSHASGESFLAALPGEDPDIVLMDVYMEAMDGSICAARMRTQNSRCLLIFLTTSQEHMPQAFSAHAFDYIVKPLTAERLTRVLDDALRVLPLRRPSIELNCDRQTLQVDLADICSVVGDAHYLQISTLGGVRRTRLKMDEFFELTQNDPRFLRINKGITVNLDCITGFDRGCCLMNDGTRLPIRTRDQRRIEATIRQHQFDIMRASQRQQ